MKKKGGLLNDFKLYYERLQSEPSYKRSNNKKRKRVAKNGFLDTTFNSELAITLFYFLRQRKTIHRLPVLDNKPSDTISVNDRKTLPKVPQPNKKHSCNSKREDLV